MSLILLDDPIPNPLLLEKLGGIPTLQQRERRQQPRFGTTAGAHGYRPRRTGNRPACMRIQDMAIADSVVQKEAVCIAAGRERAVLQGQNHRRITQGAGALDALLSSTKNDGKGAL